MADAINVIQNGLLNFLVLGNIPGTGIYINSYLLYGIVCLLLIRYMNNRRKITFQATTSSKQKTPKPRTRIAKS